MERRFDSTVPRFVIEFHRWWPVPFVLLLCWGAIHVQSFVLVALGSAVLAIINLYVKRPAEAVVFETVEGTIRLVAVEGRSRRLPLPPHTSVVMSLGIVWIDAWPDARHPWRFREYGLSVTDQPLRDFLEACEQAGVDVTGRMRMRPGKNLTWPN